MGVECGFFVTPYQSACDRRSLGLRRTWKYDRMRIVIAAWAVYRAGKSMAVFLHSP
jgi:hypothetical protein